MVTVKEVAEKLLKYRTEKKLTQRDAADVLGFSNKTICAIEREKESIRKVTLMKVLLKLEKINE